MRMTHLRLQCEDLSLFGQPDPSKDLSGPEVVERTNFIFITPFAPVPWSVGEHVVDQGDCGDVIRHVNTFLSRERWIAICKGASRVRPCLVFH
jgi:hypothetical protein